VKPVYWDTEVLPRMRAARPCEMLFFVLPLGYAPQWTKVPKTGVDTNVVKSGFLPAPFLLEGYGLSQDGEALEIPCPVVECHYDARPLFQKSQPVCLDLPAMFIEADKKFIMRLVWPRQTRPQSNRDIRLKLTLWGRASNVGGTGKEKRSASC